MSEESDVYLYVYDLSEGHAARLSMMLLKKQIDGIWHTGVVVYDKEYYFGSGGISASDPGTVIGEPLQKIHLGRTFVPREILLEYLDGLHQTSYRGECYNLINHNCNNFSDELCHFLVGKGVPNHIISLPEDILNTPFGHTFGRLIENISTSSPNLSEVRATVQGTPHTSSTFFNNSLHNIPTTAAMSDSGEGDEVGVREQKNNSGSNVAEQIADEERREREERRRNREPPLVYKDAVDPHIEFDKLVGLIDGKLTEEEQLSLEELHQYMFQDEGSWALGDNFLNFIGRLLTDSSLGSEVSVCCLHVLAAAALKDDVILMLHQDRKFHILMNYAYDVDRLPLAQQRALALFVCNLFENGSSSEWMLYISEWQNGSTSLSNIRVTTKVAVHSLLSEDAELIERGTAIVHNLSTKEVKTVVFDDVAVELTMAVLQFIGTGTPSESHLFRCLKALAKFCQIAGQDVPQLIQMIGPHPSTFKGQSSRNDTLIEEISKRIR